jgi:uncharacterized membrane protein YhaH (DUF805 family)
MTAENPYQSPQFATEAVAVPPQRRGLMWLLFSFRGRIPRRFYWGATLGATAVFFAVIVGFSVVLGDEHPVTPFVILPLYVLVVWIGLAVEVKRWHDLNKPGWWCLIRIIPLVGPVWVLVEAGCLRGTEGPNNFGPDPT